MLKRCLSPLTLVNQVALIVLLSTAIGVTGMATVSYTHLTLHGDLRLAGSGGTG